MAGVDAGTSYATNTTTYSSTIRTKYLLDLLKTAEGKLVADRFANKQVVGRGEGGTVRVNRLLRPAKQTTESSAGYLYDYDDAKALTSNYIDIQPALWGDSFAFTDVEDIQSFISDPQNKDVIANQMARSLDYQVMKTMATQCLRHRIDKDSTYQVSGTVDSGSTTTVVDDALTQADDAWNGGFICFTNPSGPGYDQVAKISDFVASTDTLTMGTITTTPTTSTKYRLTVGTGIAATDKLTSTALLDVSALHEKLETEKFSGAMYRMFLDSAQHRDLWDDTTFLNSAIYDNSDRFANYKIGRWLDIEFMATSEMYREDVDGTENQSTGVVYVAPVFGKNAYTVIRWGMGQSDFGVKFIVVDKADSGNLREGVKWLSWKAYFASKVTRGTSIIGLMTGATDPAISVW